MRTYALAIAFAAALFYPVPSSSQGIEIGPGGVQGLGRIVRNCGGPASTGMS